MLIIQKDYLRAALNCASASTRDGRYWIKSVLIERTQSGDIHICGTDGTVLFVGRMPSGTACDQVGHWSILIPLDAVKQALKGDKAYNWIELSPTEDGSKYTLGTSTVFTPVDGLFIDWRRVSRFEPGTFDNLTFDHALLAKCHESIVHWFGKCTPYLHHSNKSGFMTGEDNSAFCVVMPINMNKVNIATPFTPASYK